MIELASSGGQDETVCTNAQSRQSIHCSLTQIMLRCKKQSCSLICARLTLFIPIKRYSKTCLKRPLKEDLIWYQDQLSLNAGQKCCIMLHGSILQYLRPSISYHLSLRPLLCLLGVAAYDRFYCTLANSEDPTEIPHRAAFL